MGKEKKKKRRRSKWRGVINVLLGIFLTVVCVTILALGGVWLWKGDDLKALVKSADGKIASIDKGTFNSHMETVIYDNKGDVMKTLSEHQYSYLPKTKMKPEIKEAFVAIEDERFYQHEGIDPKALLRAGWSLVKNRGEITQGGSTITQQLVKNIFLTQEQTYSRKIEEMVIAYKLERMYSKDDIMEFYVNNINFGNGNYGFETASNYYFGKHSNDLSLAEIAFLAGIPNNPSVYNPVKRKENTERRKALILRKMKELQYIDDQEYEIAMAEEIVLHITKREYVQESYAVNYAIASATKALMSKDGFKLQYDFKSDADREIYNEQYDAIYEKTNKKIRSGGYKIYTTLDMEKQALLQDSVDRGLSDFKVKNKESGRYETQGAAVLLDNVNASVIAIVGGRSQEGIVDWFNRGYQAFRQPGSAIKPLVAYTPAYERGMLPSTMIEDKWSKDAPQNAQRRYYGNVTLRYATERSLNTIPFKLSSQFGTENMLQYLKKMHFANIVDGDNHAGIAVGGFTIGVTPLEMAGAYSTLARNGLYEDPSAIIKIIDESGAVIYKNAHTKEAVYNSGSSYVMTDVLKGVLTERYASGYGLGVKGMPTAGKTGTTNDSKDGWFAGYTPYYTAVVWVGNDNPKSIRNLYGASYPGEIWNDFMTKVHDGLDPKEFEVPKDVKERYVSNKGMVSDTPRRGWEKEWVPDVYMTVHSDRLTRKEEVVHVPQKVKEKEEKEIEGKTNEPSAKQNDNQPPLKTNNSDSSSIELREPSEEIAVPIPTESVNEQLSEKPDNPQEGQTMENENIEEAPSQVEVEGKMENGDEAGGEDNNREDIPLST